MLEIVGIVGVVCILICYFLLQRDVWTPHSPKYLGLNIAGSFLVIISLIGSWNLPSFLIQSFWIAISLYGLYKHYKEKV